MDIAEGEADPFQLPFHRLHYTLAGIKRAEAERGGSQRERQQITPSILRKMKAIWDKSSSSPDTIMSWAASCLGFFGFLRSEEMTTPSDSGYDSAVHLSFADIAVDNPRSPSIMCVSIKQSKTGPFRKGINLYIGKTSTDLCPVLAMLNYLLVRGRKQGPLFLFKNGQFLTRDRLFEQSCNKPV